MNISKRTKTITKLTLMVAFLIVASYITIPLPFTAAAINGQTFAINLIALMLTPAESAITIVVYLLLGFIGLPVFSGGTSGITRIFGPTGGYYFGYLAAAILISFVKGKKYSFPRYLTSTVVVGMPIIYLIGGAWMMVVSGLSFQAMFLSAVLPFIPLDLVKCAAASIVAKPLQKVNQSYE